MGDAEALLLVDDLDLYGFACAVGDAFSAYHTEALRERYAENWMPFPLEELLELRKTVGMVFQNPDNQLVVKAERHSVHLLCEKIYINTKVRNIKAIPGIPKIPAMEEVRRFIPMETPKSPPK